MSLEIPPGSGVDCIVADPARDVGKTFHVHIDAKGALKAYVGPEYECPDMRKRRTFKELQRPRSM